MIGSRGAAATLVLDTNVVLDWLYFRDHRCATLAHAIASGRVRWLASPAMRAELQHVLGRGIAGTWPGDAASTLQDWDRWATSIEAAIEAPSTRTMRCTDPDDQKFIDFALQVRASALLTSDRALLKLARRAGACGLNILPVRAWRPQT